MFLRLSGNFFLRSLTALRLSQMGRIVREFAPFKARVLVVLFLGLVISAIQPASVALVQKIVDELQRGTGLDPAFFRWVPLSLVALFVVSGLAKYFYNTWRRYLAEEVIAKLRERLFQKYLHLPLAILDKKRTGDMLSTLQNDLAQINSGIDTLCLVMKEPFTFLGLIGAAFYCDWKLTLSTMIVAPVVILLFSRSGKAVKRYSTHNLEQFSDLLSLSQESMVGSRVVKVFRLENTLIAKFRAIQKQYLGIFWKSIRVQELATPLVELVGALIVAGVLVYGGYQASQGDFTPGQLVAFVVAIGLAQMPIKQLNNAFLKLKIAESAAERLFAVLDSASSAEKTPGLRRVSEFKDRIRFENVSLTYDEKPVLRQVSFEARPGELIALVGQSGSGKTSIVNLLPRLYDYNHGRISLDGVELRDYYLDDLRSLFSFVTQDVFLFHDTIFNNIKYGNPFATDEAVERAAELAHCTDFIRNLPRGFDSKIGDRGMLLSGGERQRIAIARAFLKGAPILVLDEATSNLDSRSELIVQAALDELIAGRTTFVVAHRLSTVRKAHRILVLEKGQIVETGNHENLVAAGGHYHHYLSVQQGLN